MYKFLSTLPILRVDFCHEYLFQYGQTEEDEEQKKERVERKEKDDRRMKRKEM
jgi:hypothetical protein